MTADLYIRPPVEAFQLLDFTACHTIAELGYDFAQQEIAAWKRR